MDPKFWKQVWILFSNINILASHLHKRTSCRLVPPPPPFISLKRQRQSGMSAPQEKHSSSFPLWPNCAQRVRVQVKEIHSEHTVYTFTKNTFNFSLFLPRFESVTHCQDDSGHMLPFQRRCPWPQDRRPGNGITDNVRFGWRSYKLWLKRGHTAVCGGGGQRSAFTKLCSGSVSLGTTWNIKKNNNKG